MEQLAKTLLEAAQLEAKLTDVPVSKNLETHLKLWGAKIFRLVVMGEIKKGKSSFINALLGVRDLVPVSSDVATSTIFKIFYGKELGYRVHFFNESGKQPLIIDSSDLSRFGTEDGNPNNREQVDFIEVRYPSPILESGIVIIDTPGLGGLFRAHKQITYQYVPRADAVFFVTDSVESPIGQLETEYLEDIRKITQNLYFVQTKSCSVDSEARDARKNNNLSILSRSLKIDQKKLRYFTVDSELRFEADESNDKEDLHESGYPLLVNFIRKELQAKQEILLAARALTMCEPIVGHLHEICNLRKKNVDADTEKKREEQTKALEEARYELKKWQDEEYPKISNRLRTKLKSIRLEAIECCNKCRPSGEIQNQLENMIHQAENMEALQARIKDINQKLPESISLVIRNVSSEINNKASELLRNLTLSTSTELSVSDRKLSKSVNTDPLNRALRCESADVFQRLRTGLYGGIAGATIGGLIGSIVPGIGTIVGVWAGKIIGSLWGGKKAIEYQMRQELQGAKQRACAALSQTMSSAYVQIQSSIEQSFLAIEEETSNILQSYVNRRNNELTNRQEEIKNRARIDKETLEKQKQKVKLLEHKIFAIDAGVKTWTTKLRTK